MLDNAIKLQITEIFKNLDAHYTFLITSHPQHAKRAELVDMLKEVTMCSEKLGYKIIDGEGLQFRILKDEQDLRIIFRAVPGGHEFTSLLLAILNADGKGKTLPDEHTRRRITNLKGNIELATYMSLSCTNCPDVVQALNVMAILNENITHEIIDGGINGEEVERLNIQAVPTVYANGTLLHVGRGGISDLLEKLEEKYRTTETNDEIIREYDVIVAGGGPAGATAAIYSARKGLKVAIIAERIGGQVNETVGIENIPSIPYTTGKELAENLYKHIEKYPIDILNNRKIESVVDANGIKVLTLKGGEICKAPALIAATGASWRKLNIPGETEYTGRGVAYCPHCDGPFYKGKEVAVIGGGNSGLEAAIDLAAICSKVTVIEYMETLKADSVLQEKLKTLSNVQVFTNTRTVSIEGNGSTVTGLIIHDRATGIETRYSTDGIFVQIGLIANGSIFGDIVEINNIGEIPTDKNCRTATKGFYAAGDVSDVTYKQIIISMGEGAKAALSAFEDRIRAEI